MKVIKNFYIIISLITLIILRPFASGDWFGSIVVAGLFVTWIDTLHKIWLENAELNNEQEKLRYVVILLTMTLMGLVLLILIIVNLVISIDWLNSPLVLDEFTLVALLICLSQDVLVKMMTGIIKHNVKGE